ncbi:DUF4910 domain-containing protein, partial [Alphaproteobacteria bacterium]|nr:DUF4910 domain-containing protein [Alphaproteobacteria bacterium]
MIKTIDKILNQLFPLNRSLTGNANILTLKYIKNHIPIKIKKIDSGKKVFDWKVPMEWELEYGCIIDLNTNKKIISSKESNLHIIGYSSPINKIVNLNELKKHLHYHKIKDAIPYRTTYYSKEWGFCITKNQFNKLTKYKGPFHVLIKSKFKKSNMPYGELVVKGKSKKEFLISTYICHPALANDNLSGVVATIFLAKKILLKKNLKYTYRIIFIPETIGAIAYCYLNLKKLKNIFSGLVVANVGGPGSFSFKESHDSNHFLNSLIKKVFNN